jgi:GMP synthase-like glutamine amidotransferase
MRAHYFQHVAFEGPGSIAAWLAAQGIETTATRFDEGGALPDVADVDWLIVMGGPMSANDERIHPWLRGEKAFIGEAIRRNKRVLGICLGAQLVASALGARVYPNTAREIGWHRISAVQPLGQSPAFGFPPDLLAFHWHGETFDLPAGSVQLARSAACENQAFQLGSRVIGLQFHLETTRASARALVAHCRADLELAAYVQSEEEILSAPDSRYAAINAQMGKVLAYLAAGEG